MTTKNIFALIAVSAFAAKGLYELHKYLNYKSSRNQYVANISKDAIDSVNNVVHIFSENKQETELCDDMSELAKDGVDYLTSIADESEAYYG
jgi:hypothetical protein